MNKIFTNNAENLSSKDYIERKRNMRIYEDFSQNTSPEKKIAHKKNIFVDLTFIHKENSVQIEGMFAVKLSDFQIKRPSLMLQKVDDEILVELNLIFVKG